MKVRLKPWCLSTVLTVALVALFGMTTAFADNTNPGVLPPQSHPHGHTYGEWSNLWWQWALSIPQPQNPLLATGDVDCSIGQSDQVWFLAGTPTSNSVTRNCTIPAGKMLFLPIVNFVQLNTQGRCDGPDVSIEQLRENIQNNTNSVTTLEAQVDGVDIQNLGNYLARSDNPLFSITLPENNLFGCPAGIYPEAVSGGYYLMLAPLPVGSHTIHFKGAAAIIPPFETEVTYNLTVVP